MLNASESRVAEREHKLIILDISVTASSVLVHYTTVGNLPDTQAVNVYYILYYTM